MPEAGTLRVFLAVPADPEWTDSARELVGRLRQELPDASWTRPESWHLTLHFLGEVRKERAEAFSRALSPSIRATPEGSLSSSGALVIPPRGPARVLATGFVPSPAEEALARLSRAAGELAPGSEKPRRFSPHVTFARIRRPWPPEAVERYRASLGAWRPPAFRVRSCVLFQSRLDPSGAVHTPIEAWDLASTSAGVSA